MKFLFGKNERKCKFLKGGSKLLLMTVKGGRANLSLLLAPNKIKTLLKIDQCLCDIVYKIF